MGNSTGSLELPYPLALRLDSTDETVHHSKLYTKHSNPGLGGQFCQR
jgi:hypothetical protein